MIYFLGQTNVKQTNTNKSRGILIYWESSIDVVRHGGLVSCKVKLEMAAVLQATLKNIPGKRSGHPRHKSRPPQLSHALSNQIQGNVTFYYSWNLRRSRFVGLNSICQGSVETPPRGFLVGISLELQHRSGHHCSAPYTVIPWFAN